MLALHSNGQCLRCATPLVGSDLLYHEHEVDGVALCMQAAPFVEGVDDVAQLFSLPLPLPFGEHLMKPPVMCKLKGEAPLTIARLNELLMTLIRADLPIATSEPIVVHNHMDESLADNTCDSEVESDQDDDMLITEYEEALKGDDDDLESEEDVDVSDDEEIPEELT